jgi:hypothetical protein
MIHNAMRSALGSIRTQPKVPIWLNRSEKKADVGNRTPHGRIEILGDVARPALRLGCEK